MRQQNELKTEEVLLESDTSMDQQDFGEMSGYSFNDVLSKCSAMDQIDTFMKNVQVLLDAANYIENNEKNNGSKYIMPAFRHRLGKQTTIAAKATKDAQRKCLTVKQ